MIDDDLTRFMDRSAAATSPRALWNAALDFLHGRGVRMVSYHHFSADGGARQQIATDGFPEDWVCHYIKDELYRVDPIPEIAAQSMRPFRWSEVGTLATLARRQQAYLEEMRDWKLGDGLAFQVYGPGLRNGYVGLGFGTEPVPVDAKMITQFQFAAQIAHQRYCEMTDAHRHAPRYDLSPREREILTWIAKGKSNAAISSILSISPHTVDTHLRRIYDKLDVADRTSAAIVGLGSSLIHADMHPFP